MATFGGKLDLMALFGAKLLEGIDSDAPKRGYICIPLDMNQIHVNVDKKGETHANMDIFMGPASEGIVKWWEKNRIQAGEPITVYNIPSHRISLSLTQEYREKLVDRAKALYFSQHPDLNPDTLTEQQKQELKAFVGMKSNITLCTSMWMHEPKGQLAGAPAPKAQAAAPTTWKPSTQLDADGNPLQTSGNNEDALPF